MFVVCGVGQQGKTTGAQVRAALAITEHRKFCRSRMPSAERSEWFSARGDSVTGHQAQSRTRKPAVLTLR